MRIRNREICRQPIEFSLSRANTYLSCLRPLLGVFEQSPNLYALESGSPRLGQEDVHVYFQDVVCLSVGTVHDTASFAVTTIRH